MRDSIACNIARWWGELSRGDERALVADRAKEDLVDALPI